MARSHYIYLVSIAGKPVAAFTVKHECVSYLKKIGEYCVQAMFVCRLKDGVSQQSVVVCTAREFIDGSTTQQK